MAAKKKQIIPAKQAQLEVVNGNTGVLTVQFLAAINQQLLEIKELLKAK